jgi:hypothetical protein
MSCVAITPRGWCERILDDEIDDLRFGAKHFIAWLTLAVNRRKSFKNRPAQRSFAEPLSRRSTTQPVLLPVYRALTAQGLRH